MMQNKQTHSSKEHFGFYVSNYDGAISIMRNFLIFIVLITFVNLDFVKAIAGNELKIDTSINASLIRENSTTKNDTRIDIIYDATRNKTHLNVSWSRSPDWNLIKFYSFKLASDFSRSHCTRGSYEMVNNDKNITNIILPPLLDKYEIIPGCMYQIDITSIYYNSENRTSQFFYTIPECVHTKCICSKHVPEFTHFKAVEDPPGTLNVTWKINDYRGNENISTITHRIFEFRPLIEKTSNIPFRKLLANGTLNSNTILVENAGIFDVNKNYELRAIFNNSYNCKVYNYANFTVTSTMKDKNIFEQVKINASGTIPPYHRIERTSLEGEVHNIKVESIYNSARNKIVLNLTWEKPLDIENLNSYDFKISPYTNDSYCMHDSFETIKKEKTLTSILLPPLLHKHEVLPGCSYKLYIITNCLGLGKTVTDITYTVPECVGKICACRKLTPKIDGFKALEYSPGKLNISWEIKQIGLYNITDNIFEYRPQYSEHPHNNPFRKFTQPLEVFKNYLTLNETNFLVPNESYQLKATFNNSYNCKAYVYTNFTVSAPPQLQQNIKHSWVQLLLLLTVSALFLLALIYLIRRNRLVLKELVLNPLSVRFYARRNRRPEAGTTYTMVPTITKRQLETNLLYVDKEIVDGDVDEYEFPRSRITLIREIGEGAFGQVFLAKAFGIDKSPGYTFVAVKTLREKAPPEEMDDFLSEIEILKRVGEHPNIVRIFGCCILKEPYLIIMEFVPCGDLKHYLLELRHKWRKKRTRNDSTPVFSDNTEGVYIVPDNQSSKRSEGLPSVAETECSTLDSEGFPTPTDVFNSNVDQTLDHKELQSFALQIAKGMEHLEKIPIAHRDLAARNILINEYKVLKISDFGLSRAGPYVNKKTNKMPLRWVSLEAIEDNFYDSKGDVWSFAVVLWEIGTLGAFPYENIMDGMIPNYLSSGKRLERPEICTDELYSLMLRCWSQDPQLRPSFKELVELLDVRKRRVYIDFNQLNPLYIFPPSKVNAYRDKTN